MNKECIESKCAWYAEFWMRSKPGDEPHVEKDCVVVRIPSILIELTKNFGGDQTTNEELRNRMEKVIDSSALNNRLIAGMAQIALDRSSLAGEPSERLRLADPTRK